MSWFGFDKTFQETLFISFTKDAAALLAPRKGEPLLKDEVNSQQLLRDLEAHSQHVNSLSMGTRELATARRKASKKFVSIVQTKREIHCMEGLRRMSL